MSSWLIYIDESGTFRDGIFSLIGGFAVQVQNDNDATTVNTEIKTVIVTAMQNIGYTNIPSSCHTTNNPPLKQYVQDNLPVMLGQINGIRPIMLYGKAPQTVSYGAFYDEMLDIFLRETTYVLRQEDPEASLKYYIPTREEVLNENEAREFRSRGGSVFRNANGTFTYATNDTRRFLNIAGELHFNYNVITIRYNDSTPNNVSVDSWGSYFADWVCCYLSQFPDGVTLGENAIIIDYRKAHAYYNARTESDPLKWCDFVFELGKLQNGKSWIERLTAEKSEMLRGTDLTQALRTVFEKYYKAADYEKAIAYYKNLRTFVDRSNDCRSDSDAMRRLDMQLASCYQHQGRVNDALEIYNKYPNIDSFFEISLDSINRKCQTYIDCLLFERAKKELDRQIARHDVFLNEGFELTDSALLPKCSSTMGQLYAFLRDNHAEDSFRNAIQRFLKINQTENANITRSHYLHYLIATNAWESFASEASAYFNLETVDDEPISNIQTWQHWFDCCFNTTSADYKLYLFVKALKAYIDQSQDDNLRRGILTWLFLRKQTRRIEDRLNGITEMIHPFELILGYLVRLSVQAGNHVCKRYYDAKLREITERSQGLVKSIGLAQLLQCSFGEGLQNQLIESLREIQIDRTRLLGEEIEFPELDRAINAHSAEDVKCIFTYEHA